MNQSLRRTWPTELAVVVALLGGSVILATSAVAGRSGAATVVLLVVGASPLAVATWWSIATPVLAVLAATSGWFAVRNLRRPRRDVTTPAGTTGLPA